MSDPDPLLTIDEVAERLRTTRRHIQELLFRKEIAKVKVGRLVRILESDLETYIQEVREEARPQPSWLHLIPKNQ